MIFLRLILFICLFDLSLSSFSQDNADSLPGLSRAYAASIMKVAGNFNKKLEQHTAISLAKWQKLETKLQKKLARTDSAKAMEISLESKSAFTQLDTQLAKSKEFSSYIPALDTMSTSLNFLVQSDSRNTKVLPADLQHALTSLTTVKRNLQRAEEVKQFLQKRKMVLQSQFPVSTFAKEIKSLNKKCFYYQAKVNEYTTLLKDGDKAIRKGIQLLSKSRYFIDFMKRNSLLASLFRMPADLASQTSLTGLQTRTQVMAAVQQQVSAGGANAQAQIQQNLQEAQAKINQLRKNLEKIGFGTNAKDLPEGFTPNSQKSKSFFKRIEIGVNLQSQKSSSFFPTTSDVGINIGYKLNDRSIVGVGTSYKLGWGRSIRHISMSYQGVGLRSFVDWKLKGSFWISGGYETNYHAAYQHIDQLQGRSSWSRSGLVGITKIISLKSKYLRNTKAQLLWDFLSYGELPRTPAILFRVGYTL